MTVPHQEKIALAEELLADIELSRLKGQPLLMKAKRLARILEHSGLERFIRWELHGYPADDEVAIDMMRWTGRMTQNAVALKGPLPAVIQEGDSAAAFLEAVTLDELPNEMAIPIQNKVIAVFKANTPIVNRARGIEAQVIAWLYDMILAIHYELAFSAQQAAFFESLQEAVDARLSTLNADALDKIDAINERLADGTPENISQALSSVRRLIKAVADELYPPTDPIEVAGQLVELSAANVLNRLETYVSENDPSTSRRKRLRRSLEDIHDRSSAGVHSDVSAGEAKFIFLATYATLGEILSLNPKADPGEDIEMAGEEGA